MSLGAAGGGRRQGTGARDHSDPRMETCRVVNEIDDRRRNGFQRTSTCSDNLLVGQSDHSFIK